MEFRTKFDEKTNRLCRRTANVYRAVKIVQSYISCPDRIERFTCHSCHQGLLSVFLSPSHIVSFVFVRVALVAAIAVSGSESLPTA